MDNCIFAIDISHETMTAGFVMPDGAEVGTAGFDLCDFLAGDSGALNKLVALLTAKARVAPVPVDRVAIALAGDIDRERTMVINAPGAAWLNGEPLPEIVGKALDLPVTLERRAIVWLAYDMVMLGLPDDGLVVGCYVDTHYENAIWHRGGPIVGHNGAAGTIAHLTIHGREDNCFCGKSGCVDLYGAGTRLRQMHTMIFPDTPLDELFVHHGEHPIVQDYLSMMAYPIAMECNILDPDFIVLGGVIPSMRSFPRQLLEREIRSQIYCPGKECDAVFLPSPASQTSVVLLPAQYAIRQG